MYFCWMQRRVITVYEAGRLLRMRMQDAVGATGKIAIDLALIVPQPVKVAGATCHCIRIMVRQVTEPYSIRSVLELY